MSIDTKGISCVRCHSYLFEDDDVVYCPVCGAPHHRQCYNDLGHCALEEFHGTENEYKREIVIKKEEVIETPKIKCSMCGEEYDPSLGKCPNCSSANFSRIVVNSFDFLGGVPKDEDLGDGVTAEEAKNFVFANTHRYIPKFAAFKNKKKVSWNWMAFLFPGAWMLSRKMYKKGVFSLLSLIIANFLAYPLAIKFASLGIDISRFNYETYNQVAENIPQIGGLLIARAFLGSVIDIAVRLISGLFGDFIYKNHTIKNVKKIKTESNDIMADYRKFGGINFLLFFAGLMAVQYIPLILSAFLLQ